MNLIKSIRLWLSLKLAERRYHAARIHIESMQDNLKYMKDVALPLLAHAKHMAQSNYDFNKLHNGRTHQWGGKKA